MAMALRSWGRVGEGVIIAIHSRKTFRYNLLSPDYFVTILLMYRCLRYVMYTTTGSPPVSIKGRNSLIGTHHYALGTQKDFVTDHKHFLLDVAFINGLNLGLGIPLSYFVVVRYNRPWLCIDANILHTANQVYLR